MATKQPFFQRFQSSDPQKLLRQVQQEVEQLEQARRVQDEPWQLELLSGIGGNTTILGKETEALPFIEQALALARKRGDKPFEIENLLNLATTQQYLGKRELAQALFQQALDIGRTHGVRDYEDFVLHHRGRCYVEQGKIDEARASFEQALVLREEKGDQRFIASTRNALAALNKPLNEILGTTVSFSRDEPVDTTDE
ncbi:hypothetical protein KSD_65930 [Ktedonobacter sp. SOSP1-85]|uniref:tetratricopeptide repeat protein n=1 Tax=Ktedonobacter sp. SOSP1-85 TaxID=2778367 RepID=UPI001914E4C2|nr:tetratricopeptide repeat protein [Ktedonobacter sp. SOSP1-85]GHO78822.1 hypothetical protein KSD_65930 [Ktedonobacter sp. SOSP1-85]